MSACNGSIHPDKHATCIVIARDYDETKRTVG